MFCEASSLPCRPPTSAHDHATLDVTHINKSHFNGVRRVLALSCQ